MSAYIAQLKKMVANSQLQAVAAPSPADSLRAKHDTWFAGLPYAAKHRHWSMDELSAELEVEPRDLSQTLLDAGWLRKRVWLERSKGCGRYLRA